MLGQNLLATLQRVALGLAAACVVLPMSSAGAEAECEAQLGAQSAAVERVPAADFSFPCVDHPERCSRAFQDYLRAGKDFNECMRAYDQEQKRKSALAAEKRRKLDAERDAELARLRAKPDVRLGMTMNQVKNESNWGLPDKTSRTITTLGTTEQWVYPGSRYLYFRDGTLVAIQE